MARNRSTSMWSHVVIAVLMQVAIGWVTGNWWAGGLALGAFYYGRELTQAEYRWISRFGFGRRANLPVWGCFDPRIWNAKSVADALLPALGCFVVFLIAQGLPAVR